MNPFLLGQWLLLLCLASPAAAHTIQTTEDVAATFHIEPDHNPRAGEPSQAWFALTVRGGQPLPLSQCDCHLTISTRSAPVGSPPLLRPALQPLSTEQYRAIPSAMITFPQPGIYQLTLKGAPKAGATFQPFEFRYGVTAIAGSASAPPPQPQSGPSSALPEQTQTQGLSTGQILVYGAGAVVLIAGCYGFWQQVFNRKRF